MFWTSPPNSFVYVGKSMYPTFKAPEVIYFVPCGQGGVRRGDVVIFPDPQSKKSVTHRVVHVRGEQLITRGDNNRGLDPGFIKAGDLTGRVVMARRGKYYRRVRGGWAGLVIVEIRRPIRRLYRVVKISVFRAKRSLKRIVAARDGGMQRHR